MDPRFFEQFDNARKEQRKETDNEELKLLLNKLYADLKYSYYTTDSLKYKYSERVDGRNYIYEYNVSFGEKILFIIDHSNFKAIIYIKYNNRKIKLNDHYSNLFINLFIDIKKNKEKEDKKEKKKKEKTYSQYKDYFFDESFYKKYFGDWYDDFNKEYDGFFKEKEENNTKYQKVYNKGGNEKKYNLLIDRLNYQQNLLNKLKKEKKDCSEVENDIDIIELKIIKIKKKYDF